MILDINNPACKNEVMLWSKAKGKLLSKLYQLPTYSYAYIIRDEEELENIVGSLPDKFCMRSDYRIGNKPISISGQNGTKENIKEYFEKVKRDDESGAILIYYGDNFCESYKVDGAFYVSYHVNSAVYIDYVGKGFDGRGISHGTTFQESFRIPWDEVLFFQENKMEQYRTKMIQSEEYLKQRKLRIQDLSSESLSKEFLETQIPQKYHPMSIGRMQEIKNKIIFPLMEARDLQRQFKEYAAFCNIEHGEIVCSEIYRSERHTKKEDLTR